MNMVLSRVYFNEGLKMDLTMGGTWHISPCVGRKRKGLEMVNFSIIWSVREFSML
jgi:hypothetical protein